MPKQSLKTKAAEALVVIIVGVLAYSLIGAYFNWSNVAIYDQTPTQFAYNLDYPKDYTFNVQINNNSPLTFPYINPFYSVSVAVEGNNQAYAHFSGLGGTDRNFTDTSISIGKVDSGSSGTVSILIHPEGDNFTAKVTVWYYFILGVKANSATYSFENQGNDNYKVTRLPST
jgi:hypothetical protein